MRQRTVLALRFSHDLTYNAIAGGWAGARVQSSSCSTARSRVYRRLCAPTPTPSSWRQEMLRSVWPGSLACNSAVAGGEGIKMSIVVWLVVAIAVAIISVVGFFAVGRWLSVEPTGRPPRG